MMDLVNRVMEMVVWPIFILVIGIELADLADVGLTQVMNIFHITWLQGNSAGIQKVNLLLYFCLWGMGAFVVAQALDKAMRFVQGQNKSY